MSKAKWPVICSRKSRLNSASPKFYRCSSTTTAWLNVFSLRLRQDTQHTSRESTITNWQRRQSQLSKWNRRSKRANPCAGRLARCSRRSTNGCSKYRKHKKKCLKCKVSSIVRMQHSAQLITPRTTQHKPNQISRLLQTTKLSHLLRRTHLVCLQSQLCNPHHQSHLFKWKTAQVRRKKAKNGHQRFLLTKAIKRLLTYHHRKNSIRSLNTISCLKRSHKSQAPIN